LTFNSKKGRITFMDNKFEEEYKKDITIDMADLDQEWLNQPVLFNKYARELVEAEDNLDRAKAKTLLLCAETETEIRTRLINDKKLTEGKIRSILDQEEKVKKARAEIIDLTNEVKIFKVAKETMLQKNNALENIVRLHGQSYFAQPKDANMTKRSVETSSGRQRGALKKKLNKRA